MMRLTHAQRKEISRVIDAESQRYGRRMTPLNEAEIERGRAAQAAELGRVPGARIVNAWRSRTHVAQLYDENGNLRLSVMRAIDHKAHIRYDPAGGITWDELQRIKSECGFGGWWALEVYPAGGWTIDVAPMRHLWLQKEPPPFAWKRARLGPLAEAI